MALLSTRVQIADRVLGRAIPTGDEEMITLPEILEMIDDAVRDTIERVLSTPSAYRLIDPTISINVTSGVGVISPEVYAETIPNSMGGFVNFTRTDSSLQPRQPIKYTPDYARLRRLKPGGEEDCYYSIRGVSGGGELHVYTASGVAVSGTATVSAKKIYTFSNMPEQLENELIDTLVEMVKARINPQQQPQNATSTTQNGG